MSWCNTDALKVRPDDFFFSERVDPEKWRMWQRQMVSVVKEGTVHKIKQKRLSNKRGNKNRRLYWDKTDNIT